MFNAPTMDMIRERLKHRTALNTLELQVLLDEAIWLSLMEDDLAKLDETDPEARRIFYSHITKGA